MSCGQVFCIRKRKKERESSIPIRTISSFVFIVQDTPHKNLKRRKNK